MKTIKVDNLELTEKMVTELSTWYNPNTSDSQPEIFLMYIDTAKDTLIRLMCNENARFDNAIKESLAGIIEIQDSLRNLVPENKKQPC